MKNDRVPSESYHFEKVSLLITHYNRSASLKRLLVAFEALQCTFGEIIVSDDCSNAEHLKELKLYSKEYGFNLVTAESNNGLGNNINKGQDQVLLDYTLYVQEDFVPTMEFPKRLKISLDLMTRNVSIDLVRFYAYIRYPYLKNFEGGFSEMYLPLLGLKYTKIYQYSDHPHLRRSSFFSKFGRYHEGIKGDRTEYKMCISFIKNKGRSLFYNEYRQLFIQKNSEVEPSTMRREKWRESNQFLIRTIRNIYRQIKNNYQIYIVKGSNTRG